MEPTVLSSTKDFSHDNFNNIEQVSNPKKRDLLSSENNSSFISESANFLKSNISVIGDESYFNDGLGKMENDQVNIFKEMSGSVSSFMSESQGDPKNKDRKKVNFYKKTNSFVFYQF